MTTICATPDGSSGGPYFKNKLAYGTHIGLTLERGDCAGGNAVYQKVPHIERELEVRVSNGED